MHRWIPREIAARALATYLIPGCVGRGVKLGSESSSATGAAGGGVWKSGKLEIWDFGDLGTWKSRNVESKTSQKIKTLKIQIRSAQNVGKVWISRKKTSRAPFGAIPGNFLHGLNTFQKVLKLCLLSLVSQWALFTRFGINRPVLGLSRWHHVLIDILPCLH